MSEMIPLNKDQEYELMKKQSAAFFRSGMFPDIKSHEQALVKVMVGAEVGLPPFASMSGVHLIGPENGPKKPALGGNLMATLIANHPRYSYRIKKCDKEICVIAFYEAKDKSVTEQSYVGDSVYTIQEAQQAELLGRGTWKKYPSDMLFNRAISRGARRYAPGIFGGAPMYTPDELGVEADEDEMVTNTITHKPVPMPIYNPEYTAKEPDLVINLSKNGTHTDETVIEEMKKTHVFSTEMR